MNPGKEPFLTQMGHTFARMLGRRGKGSAPTLWVGCVAAQRLHGVAGWTALVANLILEGWPTPAADE